MGALGIERSVAETLLWEAPRSLLLEAVPTLVRRLFRNWQLAIPGPGATLDLQVTITRFPISYRATFSVTSACQRRGSSFLPRRLIMTSASSRCRSFKRSINSYRGASRAASHMSAGRLSHWVSVDPAFPYKTAGSATMRSSTSLSAASLAASTIE